MTRTIGAIFKEARLNKGLTQAEVAKKASINWNTLAKIERGEQKPKFSTIKKIARILEISVDSLPD